MKRSILVTCLMIISAFVKAQYIENYQAERQTNIVKLGLGFGLDYGGLGTRLTITPTSNLGVFIAAGYNIQKVGVNGGITYKFLPDKKINPVAHIMYGYNAIIIVENAPAYDQTYYGLSIGGGIELNSQKFSNYWSFELIYPFKSSRYKADWDAIKKNPNIEIVTDPFPITFSIGYHFNI